MFGWKNKEVKRLEKINENLNKRILGLLDKNEEYERLQLDTEEKKILRIWIGHNNWGNIESIIKERGLGIDTLKTVGAMRKLWELLGK